MTMIYVLAETITGEPLLDWMMNMGVGGFALYLFYRIMMKQMDTSKRGNTGVHSTVVVQMQDDLEEMKVDLKETLEVSKELLRMHSVTDEDGVPVWYVRRSLEKTIEGLAEALKDFSTVIKDLHQEIRDTRRVAEETAAGVDRIERNQAKSPGKKKS